MIRLLVVDDQTIFRKSLEAMLESFEDFSVVGDAAGGEEAVLRARELQPDVVLMDVKMPECDGIEATSRIIREVPGVRVMMLTTFESEPDLVYQAVSAGALGYVPKTSDIDVLTDAIRAVARGESAISGPAIRGLLGFLGSGAVSPPPGFGRRRLSSREEEVLALVADGLSNREIAERLAISENTVHSHIRRILQKLEMSNRVQLATYALRSRGR